MNIEELIAKMTLEEKAGLCSGLNFWETKPVERLGVPSILMTDGPHGLRKVSHQLAGGSLQNGDKASVPATCFPPAALSACSFDRELLSELGQAIADEALSENISIVLGPGVNIKRSPLCGRNFEYFSEDPYLAGEMGSSFIKGCESKGIGTSLKHYTGNEQETRRWSSDSVIDERTLREIYLPAFEKSVKAGKPATVMCAYNKVNGEYASENHRLLTEILRDEWGFDGVVVSDWGAVNNRVNGLKAGLELEMPGVAEPSNDEYIVKAVKSGELSMETLDLAVERLLRLIVRTLPKGDAKPFDKEKHNALAQKIAAESMVLLKNENNILPLKKDAKVVFIGEFAAAPRYQGAGSSQVNPVKMTPALEAVKDNKNVTYCQGYNTNKCDDSDKKLESEAVAAAKSADVCVLFVGLPPAYESEGYDRTHMRMPEGQNKLIEAVCSVNKNVVVVLHNGSPVEMPWLTKTDGLLEAYLGGQAGGAAIVDILFGAVNPCGKLAESIPVKLSDNPSYLHYFGEQDVTEYREGVFVGYRYYDTKEMAVQFPFGHGLSYTKFEYSNLKTDKTSMKDSETLTVAVDVKNVGNISGKEIVQLYVGVKEKDDRLIRADKELRDFTKVDLNPGEKKTVKFTLEKSAFTYYNTKLSDWHVLTDTYNIMVARSSRDIALCAEVKVESTVEIPFKAHVNTTIRDIKRMKNGEEFLKLAREAMPALMEHENSNPEPGSLEYMHLQGIPEMVLRQIRLMGMIPGKSVEDLQKLIDEKLNS